METIKICDVTSGSRSIWFDKNETHTVYCDIRNTEEVCHIGKTIYKDGTIGSDRKLSIHPDIVADFRHLPFKDNTFNLVVADPPHLLNSNENAWMTKAYGTLHDDWKEVLHDGFKEWMRVLKVGGVLIFKWSDVNIGSDQVWKAIGQKPLFGHHSGKKMNTHWGCFIKFDE